jgi:DNA topoisomerase VI subunit B
LFVHPEMLPQKAGCAPHQIGRVVLKELVDNALDSGAKVKLDKIALDGFRITDNGPGIDPAEVPRLFAVNRPLLSSKLKRLPLRGMLGNGLRVVMGTIAAYDGTIAVTTRGHRLTLAVDKIRGLTEVLSDEPAPDKPGTEIDITMPSAFVRDDAKLDSRAVDRRRATGGAIHGPASAGLV